MFTIHISIYGFRSPERIALQGRGERMRTLRASTQHQKPSATTAIFALETCVINILFQGLDFERTHCNIVVNTSDHLRI